MNEKNKVEIKRICEIISSTNGTPIEPESAEEINISLKESISGQEYVALEKIAKDYLNCTVEDMYKPDDKDNCVVLKDGHVHELILRGKTLKEVPNAVGELHYTKRFDFSYNKIKRMENLNNLFGIEELVFSNNSELRWIEGLEKMHSLKRFFAPYCDSKEITGLGYAQSLESINLGGNPITSIPIGFKLDNLQHFIVPNCLINGKIGLYNFPKLKSLYAPSNFIEKIDGINNHENIELIDVTDNKLGFFYRNSLKLLCKAKGITFYSGKRSDAWPGRDWHYLNHRFNVKSVEELKRVIEEMEFIKKHE